MEDSFSLDRRLFANLVIYFSGVIGESFFLLLEEKAQHSKQQENFIFSKEIHQKGCLPFFPSPLFFSEHQKVVQLKSFILTSVFSSTCFPLSTLKGLLLSSSSDPNLLKVFRREGCECIINWNRNQDSGFTQLLDVFQTS